MLNLATASTALFIICEEEVTRLVVILTLLENKILNSASFKNSRNICYKTSSNVEISVFDRRQLLFLLFFFLISYYPPWKEHSSLSLSLLLCRGLLRPQQERQHPDPVAVSAQQLPEDLLT